MQTIERNGERRVPWSEVVRLDWRRLRIQAVARARVKHPRAESYLLAHLLNENDRLGLELHEMEELDEGEHLLPGEEQWWPNPWNEADVRPPERDPNQLEEPEPDPSLSVMKVLG